MNILGKISGRVLISRVAESKKGYVAEEQRGYRLGRGCIVHIFVLK